MEFRISDTFTASLGKLQGDEQKAAKVTALDLQLDPSAPGLKFHRVDKSKDRNFWSVRVSRDLRIIVHKTDASFMLCYVDHHDPAYAWAERRKIDRHPKTGAAQIVEVRERVEEIKIPVYTEQKQPVAAKTRLFADEAREDLLAFGVPEEWLDDVYAATEDTLFELAEHLPQEATEALLEIATGGRPEVPTPEPKPDDETGFDHPDARRRFRVMTNVEELEQALEFPWDKWTVFLHPSQQELVERDYNGPARVSGSAGTGKTIVALHRAVHLAKTDPDARVLLVTFSPILASALSYRLRLLTGNQPRVAERIEVHSMEGLAERLHRATFGRAEIASGEQIHRWLDEAAARVEELGLPGRFVTDEWTQVIDAWQIHTWEDYRNVKRLGRKTGLSEPKRRRLWQVFSLVRERLSTEGLMTRADVFGRLQENLERAEHPPFDYAVVDEAQDIAVAELRFLAAMAGNRPNSLFFAGDLGQRIFQQPFSWKSLGVDIRGRSRSLRVNYRTSHQIREQADLLLHFEISDVDGVTEDRRGTISVFDGPPPEIEVVDDEQAEEELVSTWLKARMDEGYEAREIAVFVRSEAEVERALAAVAAADLEVQVLTDQVEIRRGAVVVSTMHRAKGLEFRAVVVMACDDEVIPLQARVENVGDEADLEHVYDTERHLLYVACTRARDRLLVTGVEVGSEFLEDMEKRGATIGGLR